MSSYSRFLLIVACLPLCHTQPACGQTPPKDRPPAVPHRLDRHGDLLPEGAIARLGTLRLRHPGLIESVALSPDGRRVASAGGRAVRLWDVATGRLLRELPVPGRARRVGFAPDGKTLVYAGYEDAFAPCSLRVVEVASGRELRRLATGKEDVCDVESLAFAPAGGLLAAGDFKGRVRLWHLATGREVHRLEKHRGPVCGVAFAPDGKTLASAGEDGTVRLWDVATGKDGHHFAVPQRACSVAFSHDGTLLAWGDGDGVAHLAKPAGGQVVRSFRDPDGGARSQGLGGVAFSPDDKILIAAAGWWEATVRLWDVPTGKVLRRLRGNRSDAYAFALSADGRTVALGGENNTVRLWDVPSGKELHAHLGYQGRVQQVAWSPEGKLLATASSDRVIRLWDAATRKEVRRLREVSPAGGLAFGPAGKTLACGSYHQEGLAVLWDVGTGMTLRRFPAAQAEWAHALGLSGDGRLVACADTKTVFVWEAATGKERQRIPAFHARALAFAAGRPLLAVADQEHGVRVWDLAAGRELWRRPEGSQVRFVQFADRDSALVSVDFTRGLRVSAAATGREVRRFVAAGRAWSKRPRCRPTGGSSWSGMRTAA